MAHIQGLKGFADLFGSEADMFTHMENTARSIFSRFSYNELRTPIVEVTELFCRSIGEETDVVGKEMYSFTDKGNRNITLRPEATAGVMRAFVESKMYTQGTVYKFFTTGPMFRYERPQKGRMRQFHQINCECLGSAEPENDAEVIYMLNLFLHTLGITDFTMHVNSLGCQVCRPQYKEALTKYLLELDGEALCEDCRRRIHTNPLRVLDCKVPTCAEYVEKAPKFADYHCQECKDHFSQVVSMLDKSGIKYIVNSKLVRGLDYYIRTTFEAVSDGVGSQSSIAGGGRYDGLVKQIGGADVSGIGFACGMERLAMLASPPSPQLPTFFLAVLDKNAREEAFLIAQELRKVGIKGDYAFGERSMKSLMRQADKSQAGFTLILGEDEFKSQSIVVKDMSTGEQETIKQDALAAYLQNK